MTIKELFEKLGHEEKARIAAMLTQAAMPQYDAAVAKALDEREITFLSQNVVKLFAAIFNKLS